MRWDERSQKCGGIASITAKASLPVEIGAIYNLSGSQAELDILSSQGAILAVDQMNRRIFLTSGATSPQLPSRVPEYLFLACFGNNVQAAAGAEWAYRFQSARTAAVLFNSSESYTRLLQGYFQIRFKELGGRVLSVESYTPDTMRQSILRLPKTVDLIFFLGNAGRCSQRRRVDASDGNFSADSWW
jgi:ABC-type branched-subunit amino acid transport system substrate-binding protein